MSALTWDGIVTDKARAYVERLERELEEARSNAAQAESEVAALRTSLEEARQERDRIGELEAALRDAAEFLEGAHVHHGSESVKLALVRGHLRSALQPTPTQESESHQ